MSEPRVVLDLIELAGTIQPDSIVSRTFHKDALVQAIVFGFDAGQELSEHTSSRAAIIQILQGEAAISLGDDRRTLATGSWVHIPPNLKHSVYAETPLIILLMMFGEPAR